MTWRGFEGTVLDQLDRIESLVNQLLAKGATMSAEMDALAAAVTKVQGTEDSAIALLTGLSDYIKAHSADPAAIAAYATELSTKADALAAAVVANPIPTT